jgi:cyanuric acid amidohydrolase
MRSPDDTGRIERAIAAGTIDPQAIVAILGKTEGNGCVNDFTRGYATQSLRLLLLRYLDPAAVERICLVMSGGTEGALSPHWLVIEARDQEVGDDGPALAVGRAITRPLQPEEVGRAAQIGLVADAVRTAMGEAGIVDAGDVHYVQVKCPLLTAERVAAAADRGHDTATGDTLKSMGLSRGAAALGVGLALGEVPADVGGDTVGRDLSVWSARASTSAGVELMTNEVVVLGQSNAWSGPLTIGHAVMADAIDVGPVTAMMRDLGLAPQGSRTEGSNAAKLVALLAKAEAGTSGAVRGARHTMLDDSDLSATRHARGFVGGVLAGLTGETALFISGGAEHQGPDGGGPCAIIVDRG